MVCKMIGKIGEKWVVSLQQPGQSLKRQLTGAILGTSSSAAAALFFAVACDKHTSKRLNGQTGHILRN
jgi:hypothetical protein